MRNKTKLVAWLVSNCMTYGRREKYVKKLQEFIPVDIYGKCGKFHNCSKKTSAKCLEEIGQKYKFYLSFENSICSEYITEKFFYNALQHNMIPIVYGGDGYDSVAPPHSFIHVKDFQRPSQLAKYLLHLDKNDDKYLEYFEWKRSYKVVSGDGYCTHCRKLKEWKNESYSKQYDDVSKGDPVDSK